MPLREQVIKPPLIQNFLSHPLSSKKFVSSWLQQTCLMRLSACLVVVIPNIYIHNSWRKGKEPPCQIFLHPQGQGPANRLQSYLFARSTIHQHYAIGHVASFTTSVLHQSVARNTLNVVTIMGYKLQLQDRLAWKTVTTLHHLSLSIDICNRVWNTFEFQLAIWASDSQILLARETSSVTKVFKFTNNS